MTETTKATFGCGKTKGDVCQRRLHKPEGFMLTWVMYDIPKDRTRNKIAKLCEESGIYRVQYSIFLGELNNAQRKELTINLKDLMNNDEDSVYVFPMCNEDFNKCKLLGQAFNKELIADEIKTLFL